MNIDQLRSLCTSLPAVTEDSQWDDDVCFSVGGKMFCVASLKFPTECIFLGEK